MTTARHAGRAILAALLLLIFAAPPRAARAEWNNTITRTSWSGYVARSITPGQNFDFVAGQFVQPTWSVIDSHKIPTWVGLGGVGGEQLYQAGTFLVDPDIPGVPATYYAFWEVIGNGNPDPVRLASPVVHPGDTIKAIVQYNYATHCMELWVINENTGLAGIGTRCGGVVLPHTAEWIEEDATAVDPVTHTTGSFCPPQPATDHCYNTPLPSVIWGPTHVNYSDTHGGAVNEARSASGVFHYIFEFPEDVDVIDPSGQVNEVAVNVPTKFNEVWDPTNFNNHYSGFETCGGGTHLINTYTPIAFGSC